MACRVKSAEYGSSLDLTSAHHWGPVGWNSYTQSWMILRVHTHHLLLLHNCCARLLSKVWFVRAARAVVVLVKFAQRLSAEFHHSAAQ